jgi:hypothetical protein
MKKKGKNEMNAKQRMIESALFLFVIMLFGLRIFGEGFEIITYVGMAGVVATLFASIWV